MNIKEKSKFQQIKDRLKLTDHDIALMFGYKDGNSLRNSSRFEAIKTGVISLYEKIGDHLSIN